ncbi:MAG: two-component system, NtrC family, sensor kinase [Cryptosporangiaceae bacterium]|nr:two-component system, NtrC family, sensor kinase [Cryptosporangiaceae bacterium]
MISSIVEGRALARAAVAGLAIGLVLLAGLAVWSTASMKRATAHVRELNKVSDAWGIVFEQINIDHDVTQQYLEATTDLGRQPLASAVGLAATDLHWIERHGGPDDARSARFTEATYETYTDTLRAMMAAGSRRDPARVAEYAAQAELAARSLRSQITASIDRTRLATTDYLETVERANLDLELRTKTTAGADFVLLVICSAVLLGYQRRVERQAAHSRTERDRAVALAGATNRDEVIQVGLTAAVALGSSVSGAVLATGGGSALSLSGAGDWAAGETAGFRVQLADPPQAVVDALASGDAALLTAKDAADLATALRLIPRRRFLVVPLAIQRDVIGLLILGLRSRPSRELDGAVADLAHEVASTLDKVRTSERLRVIVEHSSDLLFLTGGDKTIRFANPAAEAAVGRPTSELAGSDLRLLVHPDDRAEAFADATPSGTRAVCRLRRADGDWMQVEMTIGRFREHDGSISLVVNSRDLSDRHRLEVELRHAQKLESVGRLAAGIAHEINTPVQFIGDNVRFLESSFADLLRLREAHDSVLSSAGEPSALEAAVAAARALEADLEVDFVVEEVPGAIRQTLDGVARVATIVRAMKAFGYTSNEDKTPADLNEAIRNTLVVANSELKFVADVQTEFGDLPPVWCHIGDINQVVLNLVINAAHAIAAAGTERGTIRVSTRAEAGDAVLEVTDSGTGIPPDVADKVFEAFFTTKEVGSGTGQGLALCRSLVVDRHRGTIDFTTEPGAGTTFTVRLPIAAASNLEPGALSAEKAEART